MTKIESNALKASEVIKFELVQNVFFKKIFSE